MLDKYAFLWYDIVPHYITKGVTALLLYDIEIRSIPKIKYNCVLKCPQYRASISEKRDLFELCFVESGEFVCQSESGSVACTEGHLYPMVFTEKCHIYTESDRPVRMICIGIECEHQVRVIDSNKLGEKGTRELLNSMLSGDRFIIPKNGVSEEAFEGLSQYFQRLVTCTPGERVGEEMKAISLFLDLMSKITKCTMDEVAYDTNAFPTSVIAYSEMIVSYIIKHYRERINVSDIADELGLTQNYVHAIFRQVKGMTIIDYITNYRLELAKVYIERFGLKSYQASHLVGIEDPAYFSRLFKRRYGMNVKEACKK